MEMRARAAWWIGGLLVLTAHCSSSSSSSSGDDAGGGGSIGDDNGYDGGGIDLEGGPVSPDGGDGASGLPRSCDDALAAGVTTDGEVVIDPDGDGPIAPFHVYCAGMSAAGAAPKAYVTLAPGTTNTTTFAGGGYCACPDFVRTFTKVHIDPAKMSLDTTDVTFSTTSRDATCDTGKQNCQGPAHTYFATPGSCVTNNDASGSASLDLTGTELHLVATTAYVGEGYMANGSVKASADGKTASVKGGGACGYWAPSPSGSERLRVARD